MQKATFWFLVSVQLLFQMHLITVPKGIGSCYFTITLYVFPSVLTM